MQGVSAWVGPAARAERAAAPQDLECFELGAQVRSQLPALQARARWILGDDDAAADAVQEALIALWRTRCAPPHLGRWLLRAVVHRSLHARRTRLRRARWEAAAGEGEDDAERCALCDPQRALEVGQLWQWAERLAATLGAEQREVWLLRDRDGLEYAEISARLAVPLGTVRSRLHRARAQLRARIQQELAPAARSA